jgi:7-cyano-7-deazaguanine synthase
MQVAIPIPPFSVAPKSVILTFSGGMDSTVLLAYLLVHEIRVRCLSVDYGQRHRRELQSAVEIARYYGVEHKVINLKSVNELMQGSSQTSPEIDVPEGHYAEESMKKTVVPNRNMILLALAGAWAVSTKSEAIAYAAHAGDHAIYPDCREEFTHAMERAFKRCDWHKVALLRPFIRFSKTDICKTGAILGAPLHMTWSCYKGGERHCGKCGTDVERRESFVLAGVPDPTLYE